jgi:hypothetical protein
VPGEVWIHAQGAYDWTFAGWTYGDGLLWRDPQYADLFDTEAIRGLKGATLTIDLPIRQMSARGFARLTGRRHPRITRFHREYRRRRCHGRRWRRG